jgi:hypothetical protein
LRKKAIAVAMVAVITIGTFPLTKVSAVTTNTKNYEVIVDILNLMDTDKAIYSNNQTKITRAQFAQILCNFTDATEELSSSNLSVYPDVRSNYWAANYVRYVVEKGYMSAYLDGEFKPNQAITLQEAVYSILKVLGYENTDFVGNLTTKVMSLYKKKALNTNISLKQADALTKEACTWLLYNGLRTSSKNGIVYGEQFGLSLDSNKEINYLSLINSQMSEATIATDDWKNQFKNLTSSTKYYLNDVATSASKIKKNDVLYYVETLDLLLAYRNKVTGTISSIKTQALKPESVRIHGTDYSFATLEAANEFSIFGSVSIGDVVTILLGKDQTIVGYVPLSEATTQFTGIVTSYHEIESTIITTDYTITIVNSNGEEQSYTITGTKDQYSEGDLVNAVVKDGNATITRTSYTGEKAFVNSSSTKIGNYVLADNATILDYYEGSYVNVFPTRLSNATLEASDILYMSLNEDKEIQELILNNYTNDLYSYGVVTGVGISNKSVSFIYDLNGTSGSTTTSIAAGTNVPVGLLLQNNTVIASQNLYQISVKDLSEGSITDTSNKIHLLSEQCVAYLFEDEVYEYSSLGEISDLKDYTLIAYYDKSEAEGGRVRVIVATKNS